jgi:hypothetical protein
VGGLTQTYPGMEAANTVTFSNSWAQEAGYETVGYFIDGEGMVHLHGAMDSGTMTTTAFTLPTGYRPAAQHDFAVCGADIFAAVRVTAAGAVIPIAGTNTRISLDGISFRAA